MYPLFKQKIQNSAKNGKVCIEKLTSVLIREVAFQTVWHTVTRNAETVSYNKKAFSGR
jgi:hypothetical protein